ncbi:fumarate hydratase class II [Bacillus sp. TBS-096]|nr:fumarate hydratase class II [Bacillus sp. TBS-096]
MTEFRIEKDTMGEIKVPKDKFWGAQNTTKQRKFQNRF